MVWSLISTFSRWYVLYLLLMVRSLLSPDGTFSTFSRWYVLYLLLKVLFLPSPDGTFSTFIDWYVLYLLLMFSNLNPLLMVRSLISTLSWWYVL